MRLIVTSISDCYEQDEKQYNRSHFFSRWRRKRTYQCPPFQTSNYKYCSSFRLCFSTISRYSHNFSAIFHSLTMQSIKQLINIHYSPNKILTALKTDMRKFEKHLAINYFKNLKFMEGNDQNNLDLKGPTDTKQGSGCKWGRFWQIANSWLTTSERIYARSYSDFFMHYWTRYETYRSYNLQKGSIRIWCSPGYCELNPLLFSSKSWNMFLVTNCVRRISS